MPRQRRLPTTPTPGRKSKKLPTIPKLSPKSGRKSKKLPTTPDDMRAIATVQDIFFHLLETNPDMAHAMIESAYAHRQLNETRAAKEKAALARRMMDDGNYKEGRELMAEAIVSHRFLDRSQERDAMMEMLDLMVEKYGLQKASENAKFALEQEQKHWSERLEYYANAPGPRPRRSRARAPRGGRKSSRARAPRGGRKSSRARRR